MNIKYPALGLNYVLFSFAGRRLNTTSWQPHNRLQPRGNPDSGISWSVRRWRSAWTKPVLDEEDLPCERRIQTWRIHRIQDWAVLLRHKASVTSAEELQKGLLSRIKDDLGGEKKNRSPSTPVKWWHFQTSELKTAEVLQTSLNFTIWEDMVGKMKEN